MRIHIDTMGSDTDCLIKSDCLIKANAPAATKRIFLIVLVFCISQQLNVLLTFSHRSLRSAEQDEPISLAPNNNTLQTAMGGEKIETAEETAESNKANEDEGLEDKIHETVYQAVTIKDDDGGLAFEYDVNDDEVVNVVDVKEAHGQLLEGKMDKNEYIQIQKNLSGLKKQTINNKRRRPRKRKDPYEDDIERAMFVISMGEKAAKTKTIERFVYSARNIGKYSDWIIVLTDAPADRYEDMMKWTDKVIIMKPKEEDVKTHYKVSNMIYKRFKTLALDYMDRDIRLGNVAIVYYLDADIVFGENMNKAFTGLETTYGIGPLGANSTNATSLGRGKMWMFRGNSDKWMIQGGQMILDRRKSQPCLERWRKGFDDATTAEMGKDQFLLMEIKAEMDAARNATMNQTQTIGDKIELECEIEIMEQEPYIEFPLVHQIRRISIELTKRKKKFKNKEYTFAPLVHVRNDGGTAVMKEKYIQPYMRKLLRFRERQRDPLGILKKVRMETSA